jgi:hypothetical protein
MIATLVFAALPVCSAAAAARPKPGHRGAAFSNSLFPRLAAGAQLGRAGAGRATPQQAETKGSAPLARANTPSRDHSQAQPKFEDVEAVRIASLLDRIKADPAERARLYADVESVISAVRAGRPIAPGLRLDRELPTAGQAKKISPQPASAPAESPQQAGVPTPASPVGLLSTASERVVPAADRTTPVSPWLASNTTPAPPPTSKITSEVLSPLGTQLDLKAVSRLVHWAQVNGCPVELALATAWQESRITLHPPNGTSGEIGILQILPQRARLEGVAPVRLKNPEVNMWLGTKLLAQYYREEGSVERAAKKYVAGPHVFDKNYPDDIRTYINWYSVSVAEYARHFSQYSSILAF